MSSEASNFFDVRDPEVIQMIQSLMYKCGNPIDPFAADLVTQVIQTGLKLMQEGHDTGQLKLISRALKEMRHAYNVFNQYPDAQCITIFGSARTPEDHPDYICAKNFSIEMAKNGWMCITGAAHGIMKAGLEGPKREGSFGLSIRLPFEIPTTAWLEGDHKLITFRYFFTRKLMFISHANAVAAFPGGFGTQDELFEVLTLMQTGKANLLPVILLEGQGGTYWENWEYYVRSELLSRGWISADDLSLCFRAPTIESAVSHIAQFYRRYHSSRYVGDRLVIRLKTPLSPIYIEELGDRFGNLVAEGTFEQGPALAEESEEMPELLRLSFIHTRRDFALLRQLIDAINTY